MKSTRLLKQLQILSLFGAFVSVAGTEAPVTAKSKVVDPGVTGEEEAVLTSAPLVPPPITRKTPTKVVVNLEVREVVKKLSDGVEYLFWTFGGAVPGKFIRVREGDHVEFHLKNHPSSRLPHNIDLHAVTGPGGGAASSFTAPGHESQFSFKALNPGLYVKVEVPGTYILVDHALFRAFNKGTLGMLKVNGPDNLLAYSGKEVDAVYLGSQAEAGTEAEKRVAALEAKVKEAIKTNPEIANLTKEIQIERGKRVFMQTCFVCHQVEGQGIPNQIPPLAKSDYLMADKDRAIRQVLQGSNGDTTVNGVKYNGTMIPLNYLPDEDIANVVTFVRNSWGNSGDAVHVNDVRRIRSEAPKAQPAQTSLE